LATVLGLVAVARATAARATAGGPVSREQAAEEARRELSKGIYHLPDRSLLGRVFDRVVRWLAHILSLLSGYAPGGAAGLLVASWAVDALLAGTSMPISPMPPMPPCPIDM